MKNLSSPSIFLWISLLFLFFCAPAGEQQSVKNEDAAPQEEAKSDLDLNRFESTIVAYEEADTKREVKKQEILFTGSSSILFWRSLKEDLSPLPVLNRGFGGSTIPEVIHYAERIVIPYEPSLIVFYCGENDIAFGARAEDVLASFRTFVDLIDTRLPKTKIVYLPMKPSVARWKLWPEFQKGNKLISDYISSKEKLSEIDTATPMLGADGVADSTIFIKDMLHMNASGYERWTKVIKPYLESVYPITTKKQ